MPKFVPLLNALIATLFKLYLFVYKNVIANIL
jgi:hypothetical protein